jgi:hypothetical protein
MNKWKKVWREKVSYRAGVLGYMRIIAVKHAQPVKPIIIKHSANAQKTGGTLGWHNNSALLIRNESSHYLSLQDLEGLFQAREFRLAPCLLLRF